MGGIDFRGRRRLRDSDATERLSALLREDRGAEGAPGAPVPAVRAGEKTGAEEAAVDPGFDHAGDPGRPVPPGTWDPEAAEHHGSRHREDVRVRRVLSRPALVLLCLVLLVALVTGVASLVGAGSGGGEAVVSAESTPAGAEGTAPPQNPGGHASTPAGPPGTATTGPSTGPAGTAGGVVTVHVVGEVKDPSVVTLSPGARVMDAVQAAGGFTPAAVKDRINLAEPVTDGAQITIPNARTAEDVSPARPAPGPEGPADGTAGAERGSAGTGSGPVSGGAGGNGAPVNLNTASAAELEELPRVGPVLSQRIVEFRTQHGPFTTPEQLDDVSGVGPAMLEALLPLVTV